MKKASCRTNYTVRWLICRSNTHTLYLHTYTCIYDTCVYTCLGKVWKVTHQIYNSGYFQVGECFWQMLVKVWWIGSVAFYSIYFCIILFHSNNVFFLLPTYMDTWWAYPHLPGSGVWQSRINSASQLYPHQLNWSSCYDQNEEHNVSRGGWVSHMCRWLGDAAKTSQF